MLRAPSIDSARRVTARVTILLTTAALGTSVLGVATASAASVPATTAVHHLTTVNHAPKIRHTHKIRHTSKPRSVKHLTLHGAKAVAAKRTAFGEAVLHEAARHAGVPYVYGAAGPGAFDCSGFTRYVFAKEGVSLAHSSFSQYSETRHIPRSAAVPGDIVFLDGLGHVGIYAGHGMMWDAPSPGGRVSLRPIYSSAYEVGRVEL